MKVYQKLLAFLMSASMVVFMASCAGNTKAQPNSQTTSQNISSTAPQETSSTPESEAQVSQVSLVMVGDDLMHEAVMDSGLQADGTYNYDHLFKGIQSDIDAADISIINQETILGGAEFGYTGYPMFNSPQEIGDAIAKAGFDVALHATNHTMDKRSKGIFNTIAFWKNHPEVTVLGINETQEDQSNISVIERNGIKIAMLNYTYGVNGVALPEGMPWIVNLLDNREQIKADIAKAKQMADVVMVMPHWGTEYVYKPDVSQTTLTSFFAEQGVDIVIGTHPHVVQPVEWITSTTGHEMLVYYSLGNFVSCQDKAPRMLGGMARITIEKTTAGVMVNEDGTKQQVEAGVKIAKAGITPLVTHFETKQSWNYGVYKLQDYTTELAARHGILRSDNSMSLDSMQTLADQVLGDFIVN